MFAYLLQISALFCSFSFYSSSLNLLCFILLYSTFSIFAISLYLSLSNWMFADLLQISALFCSFSFCSSSLNLLWFILLYSAFSIFALSPTLAYLDDIIYKNFLVNVSIPQGIWNGQPCLFSFCLFISFTCSFRKYNYRYKLTLQWDIFSLPETCQCITII